MTGGRVLGALLAASAVSLTAPAALAQSGTPTLSTERDAQSSTERAPLRWRPDVPRVRWWEAVAGPTLIAGAFTMRFAVSPADVDWAAGNTFDRELQEAVSLRSQSGRDVMFYMGQIGFFGTMAYRGLEDVLVAGVARESWDVAWQLAVIDAQVFGVVGAVVWGTQLFVGRQRPRNRFCQRDGQYRERFSDCPREDDSRSFISGHLATAVAGASVTCLHHARFPLYREAGGKAACGTMIGVAMATGVGRWLSDFHWPSDMLIGAGLGVVAGWVVPRLLHYGWDGYGLEVESGEGGYGAARNRLRVAVVPTVSPDRREAALQVVGSF